MGTGTSPVPSMEMWLGINEDTASSLGTALETRYGWIKCSQPKGSLVILQILNIPKNYSSLWRAPKVSMKISCELGGNLLRITKMDKLAIRLTSGLLFAANSKHHAGCQNSFMQITLDTPCVCPYNLLWIFPKSPCVLSKMACSVYNAASWLSDMVCML